MIQLRPFQATLKRDIYDAWQSGHRNVLAVAPTGAGKTVIFSDILREHAAPSVAIAHRHELVTQISVALARNGVRHRIIGAASLVRNCVSLHMNETGKSYYDPTAHCAVAGVDTLIRLPATDPWLRAVTLWVQDECFIAGTLIDGKPIESMRVGDFVSAFDADSGAIVERKIVRLFKNKQPKHMMRIRTAGHHVLHCTNGHPFWTRRGWVTAANLQLTDEVLSHEMHAMRSADTDNNRVTAVSTEKDGSNILHNVVRDDLPRRTSEAVHKTNASNCEMPHVRQQRGFIRVSLRKTEDNRSSVLQSSVLLRVPGASVVGNGDENKSEICICSDGCKKPNARGSYSQEGVRDIETDQTQANSARWKRETCNDCRNDSVHDIFGTGVCDATVDSDLLQSEKSREDSWRVQTRPWQFFDQAGDRSGRRESSRSSTFGREERRDTAWIGLDSVEVYESTDIDGNYVDGGDGHVYNFEVDELHTYVANGIVVHNCHHVTCNNKWGKACAMFTNSAVRGLGVTATPMRGDGLGLGRHADGVMDVMVQAPGMREIIRMGFLTDYRIFAPPSDLDLSGVTTSAGGDFSPEPLRKAVHKSHIVGDVVQHYIKIANGKLGVTFAVDVTSATEIAAAYREAGIKAEVVSAQTPDMIRMGVLRKFANREVVQLVNVDLFGEGFDLPAIEVVSMARPTQSFSLYAQQFGRALRLLDGKPHGIIIDHVGNVARHGLPDAHREWSLDRREKRGRSTVSDVMPIRVCPKCTGAYEADLGLSCPYCGHSAEPAGRSLPEQVDGDLYELTPEALARLRGEIDKPPSEHPNMLIQASLNARHREAGEAQRKLRAAMVEWAAGMDDLPRAWRRFFLTFGVDTLTAQALGRVEAEALTARIKGTP